MRVLRGPEAEVLDLTFSPDGTAVAAGFKHHSVYLWNLEAASPAPVRLVTEGEYSPGGLRFEPDGRSLSWRRIGGYRSYHRDLHEYGKLSFGITGVLHGAFASADGSRFISQHGIPNQCLIGWELSEGGAKRMWTVSIADLAVEGITLSRDGGLFALVTRSALEAGWAEKPREVEVWDGTTGRWLGKGVYPYGYAPTLHFSPDGGELVGVNDMTLLVWPVPKLGEPRRVRNDSRKDFTAAAFHPSGRCLYASSNDETIQVFDTATWERIERYRWRIGKPKSVAVSTDGTLAAAGGDNGDIVIWDLDE